MKIDQSFLQEPEFGPATLALIKAIVVLAHNIGLTVTAEGVETQDQLAIVRKPGAIRRRVNVRAALPRARVEELLRDPEGWPGVSGCCRG